MVGKPITLTVGTLSGDTTGTLHVLQNQLLIAASSPSLPCSFVVYSSGSAHLPDR